MKAQGREVFAAAIRVHPHPIEMLRYCNSPLDRGTEDSNILVSRSGQDGAFLRMDFGVQKGANPIPRINPSLLPFPSKYKYPYMGFASQQSSADSNHFDVVYCEMDWAYTRNSGLKYLKCVNNEPEILRVPDWPTSGKKCKSKVKKPRGATEPKVFFSPLGEPLLQFTSNGKSACMSVYVVDLRVLIPNFAKNMALSSKPGRYNRATELPRVAMRGRESNWVIMYDKDNNEFAQHQIQPRSIGRTSGKSAGVNIFAKNEQSKLPGCIDKLVHDYDGNLRENAGVRQATNTLRVTMCEFPCRPTIHNTVLVTLIHVRYSSDDEEYYRRYAVAMNATAPFNVIGRTNNLIYGGTDQKAVLYTVSMTWDPHYYKRRDWIPRDGVPYDLSQFDDISQQVEIAVAEAVPADGTSNIDQSLDSTTGFDTLKGNLYAAPVRHRRRRSALAKRADESAIKDSTAVVPFSNELIEVENYYHGWIDDVVMIGFGVDGVESGVMHVNMKDILECLVYC
ncbi:hypothetical protein V1512DRAFT_210563 [Lipomyces arxii]|uniref:uncharacterized protein n=1 Tax=Lipomyces arxii TaxID=56418 RepID=UPI0034CEF2DD